MYALEIFSLERILFSRIYGAVGPIANFLYVFLLQVEIGRMVPEHQFSFITFVLDRVGRKKPLMFGAASFVVTFSILAAILANDPAGDPNSSITAQR